ncbi:zinc ribbon domain-containing protein [Endomicrobium proavitum]|uniref:C4-type zinc ribbon domain-containing protein n=1 Tax=Endomicrobium proavitum TaxID=1408281 RepID=A0A0G3WIF6_9BACT|nr:C4-type zinc ribbon domain-containing protein [Endomicrobium proavitum]AKL97670.1 hypothetical protein Epro_0291 [Endomicrobium proavitum]
MENLRQDLETLCLVQDYDIKIVKAKEIIRNAPHLAALKKKELDAKKAETEVQKKNFVALNSAKKEKEALLDSKEKAIGKHSSELNSAKSNDIYKTLLLAIEKEKADISIIEDEVLELLTKIDAEAVVVKSAEAALKEFEQKISEEIFKINASAKEQEEAVETFKTERDRRKAGVSKNILDQYERICEGRDGMGIALVEADSCGGCSMTLRPQLVNQAQKSTEIVYCDNCSRILFKK